MPITVLSLEVYLELSQNRIVGKGMERGNEGDPFALLLCPSTEGGG